MTSAACAESGLPPHTWDATLPDENPRAQAARVADAAAICATCPVRVACGQLADRRHDIGVWGGTLRRFNPGRTPHLGYHTP